MATSVDEIMSASISNQDLFRDISGLARRLTFKGNILDKSRKVAYFIFKYKQMWHEVGNQDPDRQSPQFNGWQPLYLDGEHKNKNPDLIAEDYLYTFKEFMKIWAARKNEGSPEKNWHKMQDELSGYIQFHDGFW